MAPPTTRQALPADYSSVQALIHRAYALGNLAEGAAVELLGKLIFVAEYDQIVGAIVLSPDMATIEAVAVEPMHQRQGIGSRLVCEVESYVIPRTKIAYIDLVGPVTDKFANSNGFVEYSGVVDVASCSRRVVYRKSFADASPVPTCDAMGAFFAELDAHRTDDAAEKASLFSSLVSTVRTCRDVQISESAQMRLDTLEALASDLSGPIEVLPDDQTDNEAGSLDSLVRLLMTQLRDPSHTDFVASFETSS
ncbi:hypothetical protein ACHHYP_04728 [Achlya hypogyna]|uniref:N-acetyltransferase domain-containing protein n=1 Tax=Achlya hypogyna TaxID=1202772 RepID=A0A1V9Z0H8_ACHHY|nr:hypothetical protein ACHHYP_04728 [Achlya hypogyna]